MKFLVNENQFKKVISKIHKELENYILNEGQNEDRAKQILSDMSNVETIFSFLKSIDKSKNNKMLPVIATFYANATSNDQYEKIVNVFKKIFDQKSFPEAILNKDGDVVMLGNVFEKNNFDEFKDFIDHYFYQEGEYKEELNKEEKRKKEQEKELVEVNANKIFENDNFTVWKAIHEKICIQLFGRDYEGRRYPISNKPYCIGWGKIDDPATHLKGYRSGEKGYTFYAVLDKKKYDEFLETKSYPPSLLNIVGVQKNGNVNVWDEKDETDNLRPTFENPQEYLKYLENGGINLQNLFKIIPYVPEIDKLITSLLDEPNREEYFRAMSPFQKKEYVKVARTLTPKQVKFLVDTGDIKTLDNFVKNYTLIRDIKKEAFSLIPFGLQKSFIRSKIIQLANNSENFNMNNFIDNYMIEPKFEKIAVELIKDSFAKNKNNNKDLSFKLLGLLSPEDMLETFKGQETVKVNSDNFRSSSLPENFGEYIEDSEELILKNLDRIKTIPSSIGTAKKLKEFIIFNCNSLEIIPDTISELSNLLILSISECDTLNSIPESIGQLSNLRSLSLHGNRNLKYLPKSIGNLENLEVMSISGTPLRSIPIEDIKSLPSLIHISYDETTLENLSEEEKEFIENFG